MTNLSYLLKESGQLLQLRAMQQDRICLVEQHKLGECLLQLANNAKQLESVAGLVGSVKARDVLIAQRIIDRDMLAEELEREHGK